MDEFIKDDDWWICTVCSPEECKVSTGGKRKPINRCVRGKPLEAIFMHIHMGN